MAFMAWQGRVTVGLALFDCINILSQLELKFTPFTAKYSEYRTEYPNLESNISALCNTNISKTSNGFVVVMHTRK